MLKFRPKSNQLLLFIGSLLASLEPRSKNFIYCCSKKNSTITSVSSIDTLLCEFIKIILCIFNCFFR